MNALLGQANTEGRKEVSNLVESLELISARLIEVMTTTAQIATSQTPEIRRLFDTWLQYTSDEILRKVGATDDGDLDIEQTATEFGISSSSILSLLLALQRQGKIHITHVKLSEGNGRNEDICDCLK